MIEFPKKDQVLMEDIRRGGVEREEALAMIFNFAPWQKTVLLKVQEYKGNEENAREVMADTLITLDRKIRNDTYREESNLFTFSIAIAKQIWWNKKRKLMKLREVEFRELPPEGEIGKPDFSLEQEELRNLLKPILLKIGDPCRSILTLWAKGHSSLEIGEKMKYLDSNGQIKTKYTNKMVYRCKKRISNLVHNDPQTLEAIKPYRWL